MLEGNKEVGTERPRWWEPTASTRAAGAHAQQRFSAATPAFLAALREGRLQREEPRHEQKRREAEQIVLQNSSAQERFWATRQLGEHVKPASRHAPSRLPAPLLFGARSWYLRLLWELFPPEEPRREKR